LCDDIEVTVKDGVVCGLKNACLKGGGLFRSHSSEQRLKPSVDGKLAEMEEAVKAAAELLGSARHPLIYGLDVCTDAAQEEAFKLGERLGAALDDPSSICQGELVRCMLDGSLPTCTLDEVRDSADVLLYWGTDAMNSQPRHFSRYTYYPRGAHRQHGYSTDRSLLVVDVRKTDTAKIAGRFYQVRPGGDAGVLAALGPAMEGRAAACDLSSKEIVDMARRLQKAKYPVVFCGLGLVYSLGGSAEPLVELARSMEKRGLKLRFLPVGCNYNMRGVNEKLYKRKKIVNSVDFAGGKPMNAIRQVMEGNVDAALLVGTDPLSSWPREAALKLAGLPTVTIDAMNTPTTQRSRVALPTALSGLEDGGTATRIDGVRVDLDPPLEKPWPGDGETLSALRRLV